MWLYQFFLASICASALTSAHPAPLPQPDDAPQAVPPAAVPTATPPATPPERKLDHNENPEGLPKHFHEPGYSIRSAHYDTRYFKGENTYEERRHCQVHMLRSYFKFFSETLMETWIAHGTLLGWWWNGEMLPWDWDIDTQVSEATLLYMGKHHNMTMYDYVAADDPNVKRSYLLDVNPAIEERERGNGNNVIDARWIDTTTGLYIDITGLSETHPEDQPGIWSCKNYHRYHTTDLYPMRETVFEGVTAKVPYAYDRLLTEEYTDTALIVTEYEGHRWMPDQKQWVQKSEDELKQEKETLARAKRKKKLQKQRVKAQKLREKQEAEKQERLKQEEALNQDESKKADALKQELEKFEQANKEEAAQLEGAKLEENKLEETLQPEPAQKDPTPPTQPPQDEVPAANPPS